MYFKDNKDAVDFGAFVSDPLKAQVPINFGAAGAVSSAGTRVLKKGAGGDIDITRWAVIRITPSTSNLTYYFNADTTKTFTLFGGQENMFVIHRDVTSITITGTDTRVEVAGM